MTKSVRSKWKKKMAKVKTEAIKPELMARITNLNDKLALVAQRKISSVPMQAPNPNFHFQHPDVDPSKPLKLSKFSTNVRKGLRGFEGNADGTNGIRSEKVLKAQYKPTKAAAAAAAAAAEESYASSSSDAALDLRALQQQIRGGISVIESDDDDTANNNNIVVDAEIEDDNDDQQQQQPMTKRVILPKAADKKQTANKKMKKTIEPPTGQIRRKPKQGYDKK